LVERFTAGGGKRVVAGARVSAELAEQHHGGGAAEVPRAGAKAHGQLNCACVLADLVSALIF